MAKKKTANKPKGKRTSRGKSLASRAKKAVRSAYR